MDLATFNVPVCLRGIVEGVMVTKLDEHIRLILGYASGFLPMYGVSETRRANHSV